MEQMTSKLVLKWSRAAFVIWRFEVAVLSAMFFSMIVRSSSLLHFGSWIAAVLAP